MANTSSAASAREKPTTTTARPGAGRPESRSPAPSSGNSVVPRPNGKLRISHKEGPQGPAKLVPVKYYDYLDEFGHAIFQVVRYEPKDFRPRHRDKHGRWKPGLDGVRRLPYGADRLARLKGAVIFVCEGEKDTETAWALGLNATCCSGGGNGWRIEFREFFHENYVVILPHNDDKGRAYAEAVRASLAGVVRDLLILPLPGLAEKQDLTDFVAAGGTKADVLRLAQEGFAAAAPPATNPDADDVPAAPPAAPSEQTEKPLLWTITHTRFDQIVAEEIAWLWPGVWLHHSLNLLTGIGGIGKTFVACDLAARVSKGLPWPDGSGNAPIGDVIFQSAEDSYARSLRQRVEAAGGDIKRLIRLDKAVQKLADGRIDQREISLQDVDSLAAKIKEFPELQLVIFDPLTSYLGSADANDNAEVRRVLGEIKQMAEEQRFMVFMITHDKKMDVAAINSPIGSIAFATLPRVVQGMYRDPEDENKYARILCPVKINDADDTMSRGFELVIPSGIRSRGHLKWNEKLDGRGADEIRAKLTRARTGFGREQDEGQASKKRQVKITQIIESIPGFDEGWILVADIREKSGMNNQTLNSTIFDMMRLDILEETTVDKKLPNGAVQPGGQRAVRMKRHAKP